VYVVCVVCVYGMYGMCSVCVVYGVCVYMCGGPSSVF